MPIPYVSKYAILLLNDFSYTKVFVTHSNQNIGKHLNLLAYKLSSSRNTPQVIGLLNNLMHLGNNKTIVKAWSCSICFVIFAIVYVYKIALMGRRNQYQ